MKQPPRAPLPPEIAVPVSPTSAETAAAVRALAKRFPRLVKVKKLGETHEGRPLDAVFVTDPQTPDRDKQHLLVIGGRNGNEESGRAVALALLDWLTTPAAKETRRKQKIVVMPNLNPDGAERDLYRDVVNDMTPCCNLKSLKKQPPEGAAYLKLLEQFVPDAHVDLHARGHTGYSFDMVLWAPPLDYTEDERLFHEIAGSMLEAGQETGIPHIMHSLGWPGWAGGDESPSSYTYTQYRSLSFLTENAESNFCTYPLARRAQSGLARLRALIAWGNRRDPRFYHVGYPGGLITSMFSSGIIAIGKTAADRRQSRVNAWRVRPHFVKYGIEGPEQDREKHLRLEYAGPTLPTGVGMYFAAADRKRVKAAYLNGKKLRLSVVSGYHSWSAGRITYTLVAIPKLRKGTYRADVYFA